MIYKFEFRDIFWCLMMLKFDLSEIETQKFVIFYNPSVNAFQLILH